VHVPVPVPGAVIVRMLMIVTMLMVMIMIMRPAVRVGSHQIRTKSSATDVVELPRTLEVSSSRSTAAR